MEMAAAIPKGLLLNLTAAKTLNLAIKYKSMNNIRLIFALPRIEYL
jgi:hypothetical protein